MKKLYTLLLLSYVLTGSVFSQTVPPPYINYQAVLYDVNGPNPNAPYALQSFPAFVNISDELGNMIYREEHYASTDQNGVVTLKMGDGLYLSGTYTIFNNIPWETGKYYLIVEYDINGTISATAPEQLVSVPYSFYSGQAGNGISTVTDNGNGTLTFNFLDGSSYTTAPLSGIQGPTGATGPVGPQGPQGPAGANGASAYDIWIAQGNSGTVEEFLSTSAYELWLAEGNTGTQQDFLNTLVGSQGPQGPQGPSGADGANGTNGLNALIKTTAEPAGANCANGGTKIETGLDTDGNGTLDVSEVNVSQTQYVCDGQNTGGTIGGYQIISGGSGSFTVPANVSLLFVELYGSGGGGGRGGYSGCGGCGVASGGGGGGAGGYVKRSIEVVPGQSISYVVGVGGLNEQNGSPTIFGGISAPGGIKGGNGQLKSGVSPTGTENNGGSGGNAYGFNGAGGKWNIGSGAGGGAGGSGGDAPFLIGVGGLGAGFVANYTNASQGQNGGVASGGGGGGGSVCNSSTGVGCSSPTNPGLGGKGGDGQIIITW